MRKFLQKNIHAILLTVIALGVAAHLYVATRVVFTDCAIISTYEMHCVSAPGYPPIP